MRVLVTGACGNVGAFTVEILRERGHEVVAFDVDSRKTRRTAAGLAARGAVVRFGDIRDTTFVRGLVDGAHHVLHLAAVLPPVSDENERLAFDVNVGGMTNVIDACKAQPSPPTVVFCSTPAAYGPQRREPRSAPRRRAAPSGGYVRSHQARVRDAAQGLGPTARDLPPRRGAADLARQREPVPVRVPPRGPHRVHPPARRGAGAREHRRSRRPRRPDPADRRRRREPHGLRGLLQRGARSARHRAATARRVRRADVLFGLARERREPGAPALPPARVPDLPRRATPARRSRAAPDPAVRRRGARLHARALTPERGGDRPARVDA
ncbi:MAG: NAD-dependent epimerase/dehydratase family protein [Deltaproteobacteria bacterium]|nr:NAD-dependent epimerase/dehydratase family protein [Deltaproteobacteria bacterium]